MTARKRTEARHVTICVDVWPHEEDCGWSAEVEPHEHEGWAGVLAPAASTRDGAIAAVLRALAEEVLRA